MNDTRGISLVEILVVVLAASIVVSLAVMFFLPYDDTTRAEDCRQRAREFEAAVQTWHANDPKGGWPGETSDIKDPPVKAVAVALEQRGFLDEHMLEHLDGLQRIPPTTDEGWRYNPKTHTTDAAGCD